MEALALQLEHSGEFQTNPASIFFFKSRFWSTESKNMKFWLLLAQKNGHKLELFVRWVLQIRTKQKKEMSNKKKWAPLIYYALC